MTVSNNNDSHDENDADIKFEKNHNIDNQIEESLIERNITSSNASLADATKFKPPSTPKPVQSSKEESISNKTIIKDSKSGKTVVLKSPLNSNDATENNTHDYSFSYDVHDSGHHGVLKERFILAKVIGTGGMGVVYKAKDLLKVEAKDSAPYVAIKVLSEEFKQHPEAFIALQRESGKSQRIAHPNIVTVYDFDRDGETVFMTMEYMEGKPLDQLISEHKSTGLPLNNAWKILKSVCFGLIHAHSENVIHSDLKPGNIFITNNNITKVFDFGIARAVATVTHNGDIIEDKTIFDAGNLGALTPAYASLEMLNGESPDVRDDIYALGCVAYQLLTGKHPFNRVTADEARKQGLIPKKITNITKRQWQAIESALAFNRQDRIKTVKEFLDKIDSTKKRVFTFPLIITLTIVILGFIFISFNSKPIISEPELREKIEYEIELDSKKILIESLLAVADFSPKWQTKVWNEFISIDKLIQSHDKHNSKLESNKINLSYASMRKNIVERYLQQINESRESGDFLKTSNLIKNATRFTQHNLVLEQETDLIKALEIEKQYLAAAKINSGLVVTDNITSSKKIEKKDTIKTQEIVKTVTEQKINKISVNLFQIVLNQKKNEFFDKTLTKVYTQLECQLPLQMKKLNTNIRKLNSFNSKKYQNLKSILVNKLVMCITNIAKTKPTQALSYKKDALKIFTKNKLISSIIINR